MPKSENEDNPSIQPRRTWVRIVALVVAGVLLLAVLALPFYEPVGADQQGDEVALASALLAENPTPPSSPPSETDGFDAGAAGFAVLANGVAIPYETFALFVPPAKPVALAPRLATGRKIWRVTASEGALEQTQDATWKWTPPAAPGRYVITIVDVVSGETLTLNAFVQAHFDHQSDALNGYRIGRYQAKPLGGNPRFARPEWFVEVTPDVLDAQVSPHFTLGQFVCKQVSDYPKYLVLDARLLLKLEKLLQAVNAAGIDASTFAVLSGYRTPAYNTSIGNRTSSSRHLYGDAADIYIDEDGDGQMDDLNGDGEATRADAEFLAEIVEAQRDEPWYAPLVGGLGIYGPAPHRGPFIHVDTRGTPARW